MMRKLKGLLLILLIVLGLVMVFAPNQYLGYSADGDVDIALQKNYENITGKYTLENENSNDIVYLQNLRFYNKENEEYTDYDELIDNSQGDFYATYEIGGSEEKIDFSKTKDYNYALRFVETMFNKAKSSELAN